MGWGAWADGSINAVGMRLTAWQYDFALHEGLSKSPRNGECSQCLKVPWGAPACRCWAVYEPKVKLAPSYAGTSKEERLQI